jgi:Zn-dependent M32 family carboxypeptidase
MAHRQYLLPRPYAHAEVIVDRATGSSMTMEPYLAYLHKKYGDLYRMQSW